MAEFIDKEIAIQTIIDNFTCYFPNVTEAVRKIPAADVQPVKRGKWFHINTDGFIYCSECNNEAYWDTDYGQQLFDFCPYCGAKMLKE